MLEIPIDKDGYILASQLVEILTPIVEGYAEVIEQLINRIDKTEAEVKQLNNLIETERRLRLGSMRYK